VSSEVRQLIYDEPVEENCNPGLIQEVSTEVNQLISENQIK
jgi:hypothetical protein